MKRLAFAFAAAVSAALFLFVVAFWMLSYWRFAFLAGSGAHWFFDAHSSRGMLYLRHGADHVRFIGGGRIGPFVYDMLVDGRLNLWALSRGRYIDFRLLGFAYCRSRGSDPSVILRDYYVPYWMLALASGIPPFWWLRGWRHRRRARFRAGACQNCGYDLRATPDRCPECGVVDRETGTYLVFPGP